MMSKTQEVGPS